MSEMPERIYAYHQKIEGTPTGTGTWIDFDDSVEGDVATKYIRADKYEALSQNHDSALETNRVMANKLLELHHNHALLLALVKEIQDRLINYQIPIANSYTETDAAIADSHIKPILELIKNTTANTGEKTL